MKRKELAHSQAMFLTPGASYQEEERIPLTTLSVILGDASGSKLYWERVDKGLADSASLESDEKDGTGGFMGHASCEHENLPKVCEIFRRVLSSARDFTDDDLQRAKTKILTKIVMGGELPMGRFTSLGNQWTYRKERLPRRDVLAMYNALTR